MGFMSLLVVASMPIVEVLLVSLVGAYLATGHCGLLTARARSDINRVVYAVFTPALIFASLASTVTLQDAISWWFMPVNIGIIFLAGSVLGWVAVLVLRPPQHLRGLVVASCSAANLGSLLIIIIPAVCQQDGNPFGGGACADRGLSYASFSMALVEMYIWTHTCSVMKRSSEIHCAMMINQREAAAHDPNKDSLRSEEEPWNSGDEEEERLVSLPSECSSAGQTILAMPLLSTTSDHQRSGGNNKTSSTNSIWDKLKHGVQQIAELLMEPPTISAVLGFIVGAVPWLRSTFVGDGAPLRVVQDSIKLLGDGAVPGIILILGGNLTKGVRKTSMSRWVIAAIVCVRYLILPAVGVAVVRCARDLGFLPPDPLYQYVLMLQFAMPPALSIGTMAQLYDVAQEECSVVSLWTYLVAAVAVTAWSTIFMSIIAA